MDWDEYLSALEDRIGKIHEALAGKGEWPPPFVFPEPNVGPVPARLKRKLTQLVALNQAATREVAARMRFVKDLQIRRIDDGAANIPLAVDMKI